MTDYFARAIGTDRFGSGDAETNTPEATPVDYFSRAIGTDKLAPATPATPKADPNAEPDAPTWIGRRVQDVVGRQDPKFKDLPSLDEAMLAEGSKDVVRPMRGSALLNSSDAQLGDIAKKALGDRYIGTEKDANGYDVVHYKDKNGEQQSAYINRPGLDVNDVARTVTGALPYVAGGVGVGALTKAVAAPIGIQALAQGAGAFGTSAAADVAQMPLGSEQGVDLGKAGLAAAGGVAAPYAAAGLSALARKFVTIPALFDKISGRLTAQGEAAAKSAGVDPADLTQQAQKIFAETYAMSGDAAEAATRADMKPFGIPATKGQVTKDPYLLTQEEGMRRRLYGENAQKMLQTFDAEQAGAVKTAALGNEPQSVAGKINPTRAPATAPQDANPAVLGESIRQGTRTARESARAAENEAWSKVPDLTPTEGALKILPDSINKHLGDVVIDSETTPAAAKMAQELDRFVSGESPQQVAKILANNPVKTVDQMRRRMLSMSRGASTPEDKRAAAALYDGVNDWIDEAANQNLLAGDVGAAAQLKVARGFTREVRELFEPGAIGRSSPASRRLAAVMETADSPEGVVNQLLGSTGSRGVDQGTTQALTNLKVALHKYAPADVAKSTWDDVRLAYWTRQVLGKNGEMLGPTAIMNNIKTALANQQSVIQTLYSREEQRTIQAFARSMERISFKPPNASGSGYTAASFAREAIGKFFTAFGLQSKLAQTALEYSGLPKAMGTAAAKAAVRQ